MIATNVDGTPINSSNQLLDLLSVMANPTAYAQKLEALQSATAEYKKFVEAVAPAEEIMALLEKTRADKEEAHQALVRANAEAEMIASNARAVANALVVGAEEKAKDIVRAAELMREEADAKMNNAERALAQFNMDKSTLEVASANVTAREQAALDAIAQASAAKREAEDLKAEILAKHQEFIQTL